MELVKLSVKARCDLGLCRNLAEYVLCPDLAGPRLPWRREAAGIYLCRECMEKAFRLFGKEIVPKSPENIYRQPRAARRKR